MSMFRIYVDGALFYHPNLSKLAVTQAQVSEDAESIDSLTLSAPYNHPYLDSIRPMASVIVCKKVFFVKHFSLKKALKFPVFIKGFSMLLAGIDYAFRRMRACSIR